MPRVSVHIVAWNHARTLPAALDSLRAQTFSDLGLIVVDNASTDGSLEIVRERFPEATVIRNARNLGFSRAHNQAVQMAWKSRPDYILVMNPDIVLSPDFLRMLVAAVDGRPEIGTAGGKLLRVLPALAEHEEPRFTKTIDSVGLSVSRARRASDKGAGETDDGRYDRPAERFGLSGALALYRSEALSDAWEAGELFDEDLFAYKEDLDLAWRLRLLGWRAACFPAAVAWHERGAGGAEKAGPFETLGRRRGRSLLVNRLSTRNHLLVLAKNEDLSGFLLHAAFIVPYELAKFLAVLFTSPRVLTAYAGALKLWPKMLKKRRRVMARRKASPKEMRKWFK